MKNHLNILSRGNELTEARHNIYLELPIAEEYSHFLRLMVAGVASRMKFNIDEVDDLKIAAEEAFLMAINCCFDAKQRINFNFSDEGIEIVFHDLVIPRDSLDENMRKEHDYSLFIIKAVVDDVEMENSKENTDLKMYKKVKVVDKQSQSI